MHDDVSFFHLSLRLCVSAFFQANELNSKGPEGMSQARVKEERPVVIARCAARNSAHEYCGHPATKFDAAQGMHVCAAHLTRVNGKHEKKGAR